MRRYPLAAAGCLAIATTLVVAFRPHRARAERTGITLASTARLDPAQRLIVDGLGDDEPLSRFPRAL